MVLVEAEVGVLVVGRERVRGRRVAVSGQDFRQLESLKVFFSTQI